MLNPDQLLDRFLQGIADDEEFSDGDADVIIDDLRATRTLLLFRAEDYYQGEHIPNLPEYVLFVASLCGVPVDAGDDLSEMTNMAAAMGVTLELHLYPAPLSWAGATHN